MDRWTFRTPKDLKKAAKLQADAENFPNSSEFLRDMLRDRVDQRYVEEARKELRSAAPDGDGRQPDLEEDGDG